MGSVAGRALPQREQRGAAPARGPVRSGPPGRSVSAGWCRCVAPGTRSRGADAQRAVKLDATKVILGLKYMKYRLLGKVHEQ